MVVTIDFDGTITGADITDALLERFADPGWQHAESLWQAGLIGSRECLSTQVGCIGRGLDELLDYADSFRPLDGFVEFIHMMQQASIAFCVISDGFKPVIDRVLGNCGLKLPVYASDLREDGGLLRPFFPNAGRDCPSATCKCAVASAVSRGAPIVHIGDGRSDFCLARQARHVFSRNDLSRYCDEEGITHSPFADFYDLRRTLAGFLAEETWPAGPPETAEGEELSYAL